jgi:hypothetical protein
MTVSIKISCGILVECLNLIRESPIVNASSVILWSIEDRLRLRSMEEESSVAWHVMVYRAEKSSPV